MFINEALPRKLLIDGNVQNIVWDLTLFII